MQDNKVMSLTRIGAANFGERQHQQPQLLEIVSQIMPVFGMGILFVIAYGMKFLMSGKRSN